MSYWEESHKQESFRDFLDFWHGCILCSCDHGCNEWIVKNAGKAFLIMEKLVNQNYPSCDEIIQKHSKDVTIGIWEENIEKVRKDFKERHKKDENGKDNQNSESE